MRLTRRGDGSRYDQTHAGLQGEPLRRARGDRARPARQARARTPRSARASSRSTTTASPTSTGSSRSPATRATRTRSTSTSSGSTPGGRARPATTTSARSREELIATSIHFLPVHRLTWFRERYPAQPPLPVAERAGEEVLSLPLSPAHSDDDIARRDRRRPARARALHGMKRSVRGSAPTLVFTGLALALPRLEDRPPQDASTSLRRREPVVVRARRRDHDRAPRCRWRSAGSGCCAAQRMRRHASAG